MGENTYLITDKPPKNLEYIQKLLNYDRKQTLLEKAKKYVTRTDQTRPHSISEWCNILGSTKTNPNTRKFLEKLVEQDALVMDEENSNGTELYRLDKKNLEEAFYNDPYWNWIREISFRIIDNQEPNRKTVTDI